MRRLPLALAALLAAGCGGRWDPAEPGLVLSAPDRATSEAGKTATLAVSLRDAPTGLVRIDVLSDDTAEGLIVDVGTGLPGPATTLEFTAADWSTPQVVTVRGVDDDATDGDVGWGAWVAIASSADARYAGLGASRIAFTNRDDDTPGIVLSTGALVTWELRARTASFEVSLASRPTEAVTVQVTSDAPAEGLLRASTLPNVDDPQLRLVFTPSDWATPREVTVVGQADGLADGDQAFTVTVLALSGDAGYVALPPLRVDVINRDVDGPGRLLVLSGPPSLWEGETGSLCVGVEGTPAAEVVIPIRSGDGSELLLAADAGGPFVEEVSLTLPAGVASPSACVATLGVRDGDLDGTQRLGVSVGPTVSADGPFDGQPLLALQAWVYDIDVAGVLVEAALPFATSEAGATSTFTIVLRSRPAESVRAWLTSTDPGEALLSVDGGPARGYQELAFGPSDWDVPRVVTVVGVDDAFFEPGAPHPYTIELTASSSADPDYNGIGAWWGPGSNADDEVALPEGTLAAPLDVTGLLPRRSMVDVTASHYVVSGLTPGALVTLRGGSAPLTMTVDGDGLFETQVRCTRATAAGIRAACLVPASGTLYVRVDGSGTGGGAAFVLDVERYWLAGGLPLDVLPGATVPSTIAVVGGPPAVAEVKVALELEGDTCSSPVELTRPATTTIYVALGYCSSPAGFPTSVFDEVSGIGFLGGDANGIFRFEGPVEPFHGAAGDGDWTLQVRKPVYAGPSVLRAWGISLR